MREENKQSSLSIDTILNSFLLLSIFFVLAVIPRMLIKLIYNTCVDTQCNLLQSLYRNRFKTVIIYQFNYLSSFLLLVLWDYIN